MMQGAAGDGLQQLLVDLYAQPGVSGVCLQSGASVLVHDLPFSDTRASDLAARVEHLFASYEGVGREIWQVCAGFDDYWLLILCRDALRLTLLLKTDSDVTLVSSRATRLLLELKIPEAQAEPPPPPPPNVISPAQPEVLQGQISREDFDRVVTGLLSRVAGRAQVTKLIAREMNKLNGQASQSLAPADAIRLGESILDSIPNRGKRDALAAELRSIFKS
jgi:hypothetical protein